MSIGLFCCCFCNLQRLNVGNSFPTLSGKLDGVVDKRNVDGAAFSEFFAEFRSLTNYQSFAVNALLFDKQIFVFNVVLNRRQLHLQGVNIALNFGVHCLHFLYC